MDKITTRDNRYNVPPFRCVTLDTSHLLMSALNKEAPRKAVVFGRRKKKGSDVKMDQIKTTKVQNSKGWPKKQQRITIINNWQGKTYCCPGSSHLTRPTC